MPNEARRVYLAFQGGGAKGIAHIGGLAAVNGSSIEIAGVAGTSAGAIVAALVAAGYSAKDIFDREERSHILQRLANGAWEKPTDLFTPAGWNAITHQIRTKDRLTKLTGWFRSRARWQRLALGTIALLVGITSIWFLPRVAWTLLLAGGIYTGLRLYRIYRGLAPLTEVKRVIDAALSEALGTHKTGTTFAELKRYRPMTLKLVATNLTNQSLELFSYETTPDVAVADAVAASIRLPFVFRPWTIRIRRNHETESKDHSFLDGGLMSNLPVWSFDEERALDPYAVTVAFGLNPAPAALPARKHWLKAALDAVVAGPPQVHLRGIDRLVHIPLDCALGMLDFDASFDAFGAEVARAKEKTRIILDREITEIPARVREALRAMRSSVWTTLRQDGRAPPNVGVPRVALAVQRPGDWLSMTVVYEVGHRRSARRIRVALNHPTVGTAWRERGTREPFLDVYLSNTNDPTKLYPDSNWLAAVPVQVNDPLPGEQDSANLAVVAIIDSRTPLPDGFNLNGFAWDINELALEFFQGADFGRLARRSVSWL